MPGQGGGTQGAGGDTRATLKVSWNPKSSWQGNNHAGLGFGLAGACGARGHPAPPAQPTAPLTAMPGASARCQPESIFIPCLKIAQSGSLAHDGSSLLRLPPGSSQLPDEEQRRAARKSPPHPSHPAKAPRGYHSTHAPGAGAQRSSSPNRALARPRASSAPQQWLGNVPGSLWPRSLLSPHLVPCLQQSRPCAFFFPPHLYFVKNSTLLKSLGESPCEGGQEREEEQIPACGAFSSPISHEPLMP